MATLVIYRFPLSLTGCVLSGAGFMSLVVICKYPAGLALLSMLC